MSMKKFFIAGSALLALAACTPSNDNSASPSDSFTAGPVNPSDDASGDYDAGTPASTGDVTAIDWTVDGTPADRSDAALFDGYPTLAADADFIDSVTRAVETEEGNLELYAGDTMVMAISMEEGHQLLWSSQAFSPESIAMMTSGDKDQSGTVTFALRECHVDQGQDQDNGQDKGGDNGQDKGQDKGGDNGQDKGQDTEVCKVATATLNLTMADQGQDQDQDNGQDKGGDNGQDKGQDKGGDNGQDKGGDNGQDKGGDNGQGQTRFF